MGVIFSCDKCRANGIEYCECDEGSESDQAAGSVTLPREALNELYAMAYNQGHNDTVEGGYTYILPIDMPTYFHEEVQEWIDER